MEQTQRTHFKLAGLQLKGKTTHTNNQSSIECGNVWQRFEKEHVFDLILHKKSNDIYAVYYGYDKDSLGSFSYFIGCMVDENAAVPDTLSILEVPTQTYAKVTAKGEMTGCITDAWKKIETSRIQRKFGFDFEVYDERSHDWKDAEVDIYISVTE